MYFIGAFWDIRQAFLAYRLLPYNENRQINRHLRMQVCELGSCFLHHAFAGFDMTVRLEQCLHDRESISNHQM